YWDQWDLNLAGKWGQLSLRQNNEAQGDLNPAYSRIQPPPILDLFRSLFYKQILVISRLGFISGIIIILS
ncbi:MAG: hypothetical protein WCE92_04315, partial [Nitrososphaeraceae archaeon]